jgi:DNA polymerase epsilon subunit 3
MSNQSPPSASPKKPAEPPSAVEFDPPLACIKRLLKNSLPESTNVGKDASIAFARACGIFIIYVTACANDFAREGKRQTITANDVLAAMKELDFEEFAPEMTSFLENYRQAEKDKKNAKAAAAAAKHTHNGGDDDVGVPSSVMGTPKRPRATDTNDNDDGSETNSTADEPNAKRAKVVETGDAPDDNDEEESTADKEGAGLS